MTTKTRRALAILLLCAGVASLHAVRADSETNSLGMTLVRVQPGTFPMGSEISRDLWNEQPVHEVTISRPFFITETDLTLAARGLTITFSRTYNSRSSDSGFLGYGWSYAYGEYLEKQGDGSVVYLEALDGGRCSMGVQFTDLDADSRRRLDDYVARRVGAGR